MPQSLHQIPSINASLYLSSKVIWCPSVPGSQALLCESATRPFPGILRSARLWRNEGPLLETFPSIKTPCEQTLRGPSPINATLTARDQTAERIHVNKSPSPMVTEVSWTERQLDEIISLTSNAKTKFKYFLLHFIYWHYSFRNMLIVTASKVTVYLTNLLTRWRYFFRIHVQTWLGEILRSAWSLLFDQDT